MAPLGGTRLGRSRIGSPRYGVVTRADLQAILEYPGAIKRELKGLAPGAWERRARPKQLPPPGSWRRWVIRAGRRWGKTLTGAHWLRLLIERNATELLAIGPTWTHVHDVMVPMLREVLGSDAVYRASVDAPSIRWRNAIVHLRTGQTIDRCRGLGVSGVWADEVDYWKPEGMPLLDGILMVLEPLCSVSPAQLLFTSTPRRHGVVAQLCTMPGTIVTVGHTRENAENLAPGTVEGLISVYGGSWRERQELGGEIIEDVEGALVTHAMLAATRVEIAPPLRRISVGLDPSGGSDQQGIVGAGLGENGHLYVLKDRSCCVSPAAWGLRAVTLYDELGADRIVAERNYGGDMVESTLRTVSKNVPIRMVTASRGKHIRFEPLAALFAQGRAHIVGSMPELEDEITSFTADGYEGNGSPNRADALVWACEDLIGHGGATPADLYGPTGAFAA